MFVFYSTRLKIRAVPTGNGSTRRLILLSQSWCVRPRGIQIKRTDLGHRKGQRGGGGWCELPDRRRTEEMKEMIIWLRVADSPTWPLHLFFSS